MTAQAPGTHAVDRATFTALARARGGESAARLLRAGQLSKRILLVAALRRVAAERGHGYGYGDTGDRGGIEDTYRRLVRLEREDPDGWRDVMLHPYLDEGAARCIAALERGEPADLRWLARLAATREGEGPLLVAECDGQALRVRLACRGPFRDVHGHALAGPPAPAEIRRWEARLGAAWEILVRRHPWHARAVAACVTTLVPLQPGPDGRAVSSAARRAFGAVALSPPGDSVLLALTLVHEYLHVQLGALLDLVPLHHPPSATRYRAPWRPDLRPVDALLQGAYAHLGVTDFWRAELAAGTGGERARHEYRTWHRHTAGAVRTLLDSGELLPAGVLFAEHMAEALDSPPCGASPPDAPDRPSEASGVVPPVRSRRSGGRRGRG